MRLKFFAALFAPDSREENDGEKHHGFDERHRQRVVRLPARAAKMFRQPGLLLRRISGGEISQLISQTRERPAKIRWR